MRWRDAGYYRRQARDARRERASQWHDWFAWRPVRMDGWVEWDGGGTDCKVVPMHYCWGEAIQRRWHRYSLPGVLGGYWQYRYKGR